MQKRTNVSLDKELMDEVRQFLPYQHGALKKFVEFAIRRLLNDVKNGNITIEEILNSR